MQAATFDPHDPIAEIAHPLSVRDDQTSLVAGVGRAPSIRRLEDEDDLAETHPAKAVGVRPVSARPSRMTRPRVGLSSAPAIARNVVLPEPDGPTIAISCPQRPAT